MDDRAIAALLESRSEDALTELNAKYGRLCRSIASNILDDRRDVEECVNDSLLTVWNRYPEDRPEQFSAYISRITRNISINRLEYNRAQKRSAGPELPIDEYAELIPDESLRPDASDRELGEAIGRFLRGQKPERANIFARRYLFCDSIKAIAKNHRCTEAKVRNMLARMRGQLKEFLKKEGYYFDDE